MLDPDAKALLDLIASRNIPSTHTMPPPEARAYYRERRFFTQPEPQAVESVRNFSVPGPQGAIPVRAYRPQGARPGQVLPALVYYHGGGHTIGDLDTHDTLCRELSNLSCYSVFSVDYRLGPENKFPAAADDAWAAYEWLAAHAASQGIDAARIAVGGDSAGGNLAAVVTIMARERKGPMPFYQLLIYPATDMRFLTRSHQTNGQGYLLTREVIDYFTACYLRDDADKLDWRASPVLAADLSRLPPALVMTAGYDPLRDDGREYAKMLREAGNRVEYIEYPGQIHGFITMGRVIRQANEAVALCAERLRQIKL